MPLKWLFFFFASLTYPPLPLQEKAEMTVQRWYNLGKKKSVLHGLKVKGGRNIEWSTTFLVKTTTFFGSVHIVELILLCSMKHYHKLLKSTYWKGLRNLRDHFYLYKSSTTFTTQKPANGLQSTMISILTNPVEKKVKHIIQSRAIHSKADTARWNHSVIPCLFDCLHLYHEHTPIKHRNFIHFL